MTAAAIAMGARNRFAGALMAVGHGIIEFPLMILITLGIDKILKSATTKIVIGFAGGVFLVIMAIRMLRSLRSAEQQEVKVTKSGPVVAGIVLSGGNPLFLVWWATVGLNLAVGEFQRQRLAQPAQAANYFADLLAGTACLRRGFYLHCRQHFDKSNPGKK
jgi:threonine/homoserine/homoserine lactone efflux protein